MKNSYIKVLLILGLIVMISFGQTTSRADFITAYGQTTAGTLITPTPSPALTVSSLVGTVRTHPNQAMWFYIWRTTTGGIFQLVKVD